MSSITICVCHQKVAESASKKINGACIVKYPEITIPFQRWSEDFGKVLGGLGNSNLYVFTQSSDFLKFLQVNNVDCKVLVREDVFGSFVESDLEEARKALLSLYEELMFKECLFKD